MADQIIRCPECGEYRHKSQMNVGRRGCTECQEKRFSGLYIPETADLIRIWEEEVAHARMMSVKDGTAIILDDVP